MLTPAEHRILFAYCADHPVARCIPCDSEYRPDQLASAAFHGLGHCCPTCRADLSLSAEEHLRTCTVINVQVAERQDRARVTGQLTRLSQKKNQDLRRDPADARNAEAASLGD